MNRRRFIAAALVSALMSSGGAVAQCPATVSLTPADATPGDRVGNSVSVSGHVAVIGAYGKDGFVGAAYVYRFDPATATWEEEALLPSPDAAPAEFGRAVGIDGNVAVIGAPGADPVGFADIYRRDPASRAWKLEATLLPPKGEDSGSFGASVAIRGDVVVVGDPEHGGNGSDAGAAYIFRLENDGSRWMLETAVYGDVTAELGRSVAVDGDLVVVGAPEDDKQAGAAYVLRYGGGAGQSGPQWIQDVKLSPPQGQEGGDFGASVSISGDAVAVGMPAWITSYLPNPVFIFRYDSVLATWVEESRLLGAGIGAFARFGHSVAIGGDVVVVGAIYDTSAVVFRREPGGWFEQARYVPSAPGILDLFGQSVAYSGDTVLVGATEELDEDGTGTVYVLDASDRDCNNNRVPDSCDIAAGTSLDRNGNGIPDECDADPGLYIGPAGGSWFDSDNWNSGAVPGGSDDATIPANVVIDRSEARAASVTLTSSGSLTFGLGTLTTESLAVSQGGFVTGNGTIRGDVVNQGMFSPGSPTGQLFIDGDYKQHNQGTTRIDVGGAEGSHDTLTISGVASLTGTFMVRVLQPLEAILGREFQVMTYSQRTNWFTVLDQPVLPSPFGWSIEPLPTSLSIGLGAVACEQQKLLPADGAQGVGFGRWGVAVSGDVAIVGARFDSQLGQSAGAAYIFRKDHDQSLWLQEQKLLALDGQAGDAFGSSVSIDGDLAIVGATLTTDLGQHSGSAYVYRFDPRSGEWIHEAKLLPSDGTAEDLFGAAVALTDSVALVGSIRGGNNGFSTGAVYVYLYYAPISAWLEVAKLVPSDSQAFEFFGISVDYDGEVAVIGAPGSSGNAAGSAWIFRVDPATSRLVEEQKLLPLTVSSEANFGTSVALSADRVVIGAPRDDAQGTSSGSAVVFAYDRDLAAWLVEGKLTAPDGEAKDHFGGEVGISGDVVLVGVPNKESGAGAVYVYRFKHDSATWLWEAKLRPQDNQVGDFFGRPIDIEENTAFFGAPWSDDNGPDSGAMYVFDVGGPCPGDIDGNGSVGQLDFYALLDAWGACPDPLTSCPADLDGDGLVGIVDLLLLLANWTL